MGNYRLTEDAKADLIRIYRRGLREHGEGQAETYYSAFFYDAAGNLLAEADDSGQILRYYIYGGGLAAMVASSGQYYVYHFDGTGHTVAMTDNTNGVVNKYAYSPYGPSSSL